MSKLELDW